MELALQASASERPTGVFALLFEVVQQVRAWVTRCEDPPAERHLLLYACSKLGHRVLRAADRDDLAVCLRRVATESALIEVQSLLLLELPQLVEQQDISASDVDWFGDSPVARECARFMQVRLDLWRKHIATHPAAMEFIDEANALEIAQELTSWTNDFRVPEAMQEAFVITQMGEVAVFALLEMELSEGHYEPWIRQALLEQIRESCLAHIRLLLFMNPSLVVDEATLPIRARFDSQRLAAEEQERRAMVVEPSFRVSQKYADTFLEAISEA